MILLLGESKLVIGSIGWVLSSYVVELLCLDTNKKACVDVDLPSVVFVFLRHLIYPLAAESKSDNCVWCDYAGLRLLWVSPVLICG